MTATTEAETPTMPGATPKLNKALSQLQGELPKVKKTKTAEVKDQQGNRVLYTYDYADLGDVVADVGPLLAKFGLAFHCAPTINPADRREMLLLWSLLHESGEEKAGEWPLGPVSQKPQSLGSAITYGRRYCFTAATNIVLEDDDDGQRAQQDHGSRQTAGDAWDTATPAPPRQGRRPEAVKDSAAVSQDPGQVPKEDARPWHERALEQAKKGSFKTEAEAWALWREAAEPGKCATREQKDAIQNHAAAWIRANRRKAAIQILKPLEDGDAWRDAILELADDETARGRLAELQDLSATGQMDVDRARLLGRAVIAVRPKVGIRDTEAAA
jgi:hypothetical protein